AGIHARLFNLAFVNPSQVRDALIIHELLRYRADVIVYPMTLSEFQHAAPIPFVTIIDFFARNRMPIWGLMDESPAGLQAPLEGWDRWLSERTGNPWQVDDFREFGAFVRLAAGANARWMVRQLNSVPPDFDAGERKHLTNYDCDNVKHRNDIDLQDW